MGAPRYRHLVWDWNGTLLDDLELCLDVINPILERHALPPVDRTRYHEIFDFPVRGFYERLGFDLTGDAFARLSTEFISTYDGRRHECALHAGVADLLGEVAESGRTQSILSAHRHETLLEVVAHFGIHERFERIRGLDNIHAHSKVELGRELVAELDAPPEEILLIGDTLHDLEVAEALGIDCALIARGHHPETRLRAAHDRVFEDLGALARSLGLGDAALVRGR